LSTLNVPVHPPFKLSNPIQAVFDLQNSSNVVLSGGGGGMAMIGGAHHHSTTPNGTPAAGDSVQQAPNCVLRVIIENMLYPVTLDVLHSVSGVETRA
jgi:hypothetical protein